MKKSSVGYTAKSLSEYLMRVDEILDSWKSEPIPTSSIKDYVWFRGLPKDEYQLLPSLYVKNNGIDESLEREINRDFKLNYPAVSDRYSVVDDFELLLKGRHFGLPTRIMDWTEASLVGLFFALELEKHRNDNGIVWVLDARRLATLTRQKAPEDFPKKFKLSTTIPPGNSELLKNYILPSAGKSFDITKERLVKAKYPFAFRPVRTTDRIDAQKGCFTIHGKTKKPLEELKDEPGYKGPLTKRIRLDAIRIPATQKEGIFNELKKAGITHHTLFPDLDGLCKEITDRYQNVTKQRIARKSKGKSKRR